MSYMLQFPSTPLPQDISSPPYVLFGINDIDTFSDLPTNIPLSLVLHFAPALRKWILPPPVLSLTGQRISLRTPYVGVNILADIEVEGLGWILARMMQVANLGVSTKNAEMYMTRPNMLTSIAIHKAWMAMELPVKGIETLHTHILMSLMMGPPVVLIEVKGLWHNFPVDSAIVREMGLNFVRNYVDGRYPFTESSPIRYWYLGTKERYQFFMKLEKQFPGFEEVQKTAIRVASDRQKKEDERVKKMLQAQYENEQLLKETTEKPEKMKVKRDRKDKEDRSIRAARRRRERVKSNESMSSIETVIWNPPETNEDDPTTPTLPPHSTPVDSVSLISLLEKAKLAQRPPSPPPRDNTDVKFKLKLSSSSRIPSDPACLENNALSTTAEVLSPTSYSPISPSFPPEDGINQPPAEISTSPVYSPVNLSFPPDVDSKQSSTNSKISEDDNDDDELPTHEEILAEISLVNKAIARHTATQEHEAKQLHPSIIEGADGLVYLQPAVYERSC